MRVIVAGSRTITSADIVEAAIRESRFEVTTLVCGEARGVDRLAKSWAMRNGIEVDSHPADWKKYGKSAGHKRNQEMAKNADALIAVWDGKSNGTRNMIESAKKANLKISLHFITSDPNFLFPL